MIPVLPAVTCSMQSTLLTGAMPSEHGIVGNGWYVRDEGEIRFWRQSNRLVQHEKIWEKARRLGIPDFTCANMFWWYNMYSSVDYAATPRPMVSPPMGAKFRISGRNRLNCDRNSAKNQDRSRYSNSGDPERPSVRANGLHGRLCTWMPVTIPA